MNDRQAFLQKIIPLFWKFGAKTLTMDEVAREFSVSKKTLYQSYPNKEMLLRDVLDHTLETIVSQIEAAKKLYDNPIEAFLKALPDMEFFMSETDNIFIMQMAKYYPKLLDEYKVTNYERLVDVFSQNVRRGWKLGYYRRDFDEKIYFKFLLQLFFSVEDSPLFSEERNSEDVLCINIVDFYLNSILTEEGRKIYQELKKEYE